MTLICGIDEAGRGPVIGPLVIAGACLDEKELYQLERIGVKDSKLLSPSERKRIYFQLTSILSSYEILIIYPEEIDAAVLSPSKDMNLNWLEGTKAAQIISKLNPNKAIVDCPSNNISAFTSYIKQKTANKSIHIICEHKADFKYVICGAASILAKVTRDKEIEKIKKDIGIDFGSGYPSDPLTAAFVEKNWNKYDFFRKSWSSWQKYGGKTVSAKQKKLEEW